MSFFGLLGEGKSPEEKLDSQTKKLAELHEIIVQSALEIEEIKNQLVKKANGSLYPHLNAGIKLRET